jgi:hypothetical protein
VLEKEQQAPKKVRYPRNTDLDPQLVWRGKDERDWSDQPRLGETGCKSNTTADEQP